MQQGGELGWRCAPLLKQTGSVCLLGSRCGVHMGLHRMVLAAWGFCCSAVPGFCMREGLAEVSVLVFVQAVGFCVKLLVSQAFNFAVASYGAQDSHCCR